MPPTRSRLSLPECPSNSNAHLDAARDPQTSAHARRAPADPAASDAANQERHHGANPPIPLHVRGPRRQQRGIAGQIAVHAGQDGGGHLVEAQQPTRDDLAAGLQREEGQGDELDEVDGAGVGRRAVRDGDDGGLDEGGGDEDEEGLREEG